MARVLVVEDDATVSGVVAGYLRRAGHAVRAVADGQVAVEIACAPGGSDGSTIAPDLMVLDVMLPGLDGLAVCRTVRASHPTLPVILLTALGEEEDRIAGLETGADDYVTKPFSPRELVLRVDGVLRRAGASAAAPGRLSVGPVAVDTQARTVSRDGEPVQLTAREFDVLAYLLARPGQVVSRADLMRDVWGWTVGDQSTVTVHIRRLREKLEADPANPALLRTVWGVGYRLDPP